MVAAAPSHPAYLEHRYPLLIPETRRGDNNLQRFSFTETQFLPSLEEVQRNIGVAHSQVLTRHDRQQRGTSLRASQRPGAASHRGVILPPGGQVLPSECQRLPCGEGRRSPPARAAPLHKRALFEHLRGSLGRLPAAPLAAVQTLTFSVRKLGKAGGSCQKVGRGSSRGKGWGRLLSRVPRKRKLPKCHWAPAPAALVPSSLVIMACGCRLTGRPGTGCGTDSGCIQCTAMHREGVSGAGADWGPISCVTRREEANSFPCPELPKAVIKLKAT